jgi:hypothetical protein
MCWATLWAMFGVHWAFFRKKNQATLATKQELGGKLFNFDQTADSMK